MRHILLVEDDRNLALCARQYLAATDLAVTVAENLAAARARLAEGEYGLVVLDLMLPDGDGLDLCRELRARGGPAVVVVSARGEGADRMLALESGAAMYLAKPYDMEELKARVECCLQREAGEGSDEVLTCGEVRLGRSAHAVTVGEQEVALTPKEFELLTCLLERAGEVVPGRTLLWEVWGYPEGMRTRTLDVHLGRLRQKLARAGVQRCRIVTRPGVGYGIEEAA